MIVRIVTMTFQPDKVDDFKNLFDRVKDKIRSFPGCQHLVLLQGLGDKENIFMTYSHWDAETDLDSYRHSELFRDTWTKTKAMFSDKPAAISLEEKERLP